MSQHASATVPVKGRVGCMCQQLQFIVRTNNGTQYSVTDQASVGEL
jgi:hypothetical protein